METPRLTAIDLFCGAGGMSLGFEQSGFDVLAAFDREKFNVDTHNRNFPKCAARVADLSKESATSLRKLAGLGNRAIDVVFGGPPCQGFSVGGQHDIDDERNLLVHDFARLVGEFAPKYFVMENVSGLMSRPCRPVLDRFVATVEAIGYRVVRPISVLNASDFGVPQRRKRTFVLGYKQDEGALVYPSPESVRRRFLWKSTPCVRHAIEDLLMIGDHEGLKESDIFAGALPLPRSTYGRVLRGLIHDPHDKSKRRRFPKRLTGCLLTKHADDVVARFDQTPPGSAESVSRYIRLAWDAVAPTIRAGTGVDHGSHTAPRPIHPKSPRCISAREAARLHSFPDWFKFHGTRWHDFRQIGNSVPPLLARAIAGVIYDAIASKNRL